MKIISYIVQIIGQRRATKRCQPFPLSFFPASNWQTNTLAHKQPSRILFYHRENKYPRFRPRSKIPSNVPIRNNGVVEQWPGSRLGVFTWRRRRQSIMPMSAAVKTMIDRSTDNPWIPSRLPRQQKEEPDEYNLSTGVIFGKTEGGRGGKALPRLINKNHAIMLGWKYLQFDIEGLPCPFLSIPLFVLFFFPRACEKCCARKWSANN